MNHVYKLISMDEDGVGLYVCETCSRKVRMRIQPFYQEVLEQGDIHSAHSGGYSKIPGLELSMGDDESDWNRLLSDMNFDDLW